MKLGKRNLTLSEFYCCQCGYKGIPIFRKQGRERPSGHLKKLFCLHCQQEQNFIEIRDGSRYKMKDFQIEFEYGNFNSDGTREMKYPELKKLINEGKREIVKHLPENTLKGEHKWE